MSIQEILKSGANVSITVNALDLREFFLEVVNEQMKARETETKPERYLTTDETANMLGVDRSTLWRWNRDNYLNVIKVGGKSRYRLSDVTKLMEG